LISVPQSTLTDGSTSKLGLLNQHWTTTSSSTVGLVCGPEIEHVWRVLIPAQAQTCPFLMHSLLAFTSIHMARLNPTRRAACSDVARQHHIQASELFRSSVSDDSARSNSVSTLAFLILSTLTSVGLIQDEAEDLDSFTSLLDLMRCALRFAVSCKRPTAEDGAVTDIMVASGWHPLGLLSLDERLQLSLQRLEYSNSSGSTTSKAQKAVLAQAIKETKRCYTCVPIRPSNLAFIPHWLIMMTDEFFECLRDKHDVALALLAHWIIPCYNAPRKWYMDDWPRKVVGV
jgi:hypothetical protein